MSITIQNAKGEAKVFRNWLHAFGASHPFTFGVAVAVIAGVVEHFLRF